MVRDGVGSSSVIVRVTFEGCVIPTRFAAVPDTVMLLFGSSRALSTALMVTVPVLDCCSAAIVRTLLALREKSEESALVPAVAPIVTVVVSPDRASSEAVTVVEVVAPLSAMEELPRARVTAGVGSSSVIVPVAVVAARVAPCGLLRVRMIVSFASSRVSPFTVTVIVVVVSPAAKPATA